MKKCIEKRVFCFALMVCMMAGVVGCRSRNMSAEMQIVDNFRLKVEVLNSEIWSFELIKREFLADTIIQEGDGYMEWTSTKDAIFYGGRIYLNNRMFDDKCILNVRKGVCISEAQFVEIVGSVRRFDSGLSTLHGRTNDVIIAEVQSVHVRGNMRITALYKDGFVYTIVVTPKTALGQPK